MSTRLMDRGEEESSLVKAAASPSSSACSSATPSPSVSHPHHQQQSTSSNSKALGPLFLEGQSLVENLDEMDSSSGAFEEALHAGLRIFQEVTKMVAFLSLISKNEEMDDVATTDLKYILVDCYQGILHQKDTELTTAPYPLTPETTASYLPVTGRGEDRRQNLEKAKRHFMAFMQQCERLRLLKGEDLKAWEMEINQGEDEEEEEGKEGGAAAGRIGRKRGGPDPATTRATKIERYRREKAAKERLRELNYLLTKLMKEGGEEDDLGEKEEIERERLKLWIETCIRKVLDEWGMIKQELEIMEMMKAREGGGAAAADAKVSSTPPPRKPMNVTHLDSVGGQLRIRQETLKAQVFQPGYSQPTMSLEEYAALEMARVKEQEERSKDAPKLPRRYDQLVAEEEEDNEALVEEAAYQDRAWDDWKDAHPFGSGNKMGKKF